MATKKAIQKKHDDARKKLEAAAQNVVDGIKQTQITVDNATETFSRKKHK